MGSGLVVWWTGRLVDWWSGGLVDHGGPWWTMVDHGGLVDHGGPWWTGGLVDWRPVDWWIGLVGWWTSGLVDW